jgi:hypothetical protein
VEHPWEDNLLERKVESDLKDLLKTLVAFANSVRPGHVATILIGEKDDGTIAGVGNPDKIQQTVRRECDKIYPAIVWRSSVYERERHFCVRVEIEYSGETPHFGGPAWVRQGSSTVAASEEVFQKLIDVRLGMVRELSKWLDKEVTIYGDSSTVPPSRKPDPPFSFGQLFAHRWPHECTGKLVFVNSFWVTLQNEHGENRSEPLSKLTLTYDDKKDQLKIVISY